LAVHYNITDIVPRRWCGLGIAKKHAVAACCLDAYRAQAATRSPMPVVAYVALPVLDRDRVYTLTIW